MPDMPDDTKSANDSEEYEILPHREIAELRRQLSELRRGTTSEARLQESIDRLSKSMDSMMIMFRKASDEIKLEEHDQKVVTNQLEPMQQKLDAILSQNEKIAQAIISLAEMLQEKEEQIEKDIKHEFSAMHPKLQRSASQVTEQMLQAAQPQFQQFQDMPQMPDLKMPEFPQMAGPAPSWSQQPPLPVQLQSQQSFPDLKPLPPLPPARKKGLFGIKK